MYDGKVEGSVNIVGFVEGYPNGKGHEILLLCVLGTIRGWSYKMIILDRCESAM
jgi:hypothetical protein